MISRLRHSSARILHAISYHLVLNQLRKQWVVDTINRLHTYVVMIFNLRKKTRGQGLVCCCSSEVKEVCSVNAVHAWNALFSL